MFSKQLRMRMIIVLLMVLLGFIGVIFTQISKDGAWFYWRFLAVVYAVMSLGLSWHLRRKGLKETAITVWHELAQWFGLILCVGLISFFVRIGLLSRFLASIEVLVVLALCTFIAGIYIETTFLPLGILLGLFAMGVGWLEIYMYPILIPLTIAAILIIFWIFHHGHQKSIR